MQQSKSLLVFPTSRAIREFVALDNSNRLLPTILSIDVFFSKSIIVENLIFCDEASRFLFLKKAIENLDFQSLGISNNFNDFIKQSEYLFRFFGELSAEGVEFETINQADTYAFYTDHLAILEQIYKTYCKLLGENGFVDKITLPKKYKINNDFIKKFDEIIVYFEGYWTNFEFNLVREISQICNLKIHLNTSKYNKKSYEKFDVFGFKLEKDFAYTIDITKKKIIKQEKTIKQNQNICIKAFSLRINQIAFVKKSIAYMIEKGLKPNEIVLIVPDESFVKTLELFDDDCYFNYAMGKSINDSTLYKKANAVFSYCSNCEQKDMDLLKFLNLDSNYVKENFQKNWNKKVTKEIFTNLLTFLKADEADEEILEKFEEEIYLLKKIIFKLDEKITLGQVYKFVLQKIAAITTDDINGFAITVMGLLETRGLSIYKGVIVVDFNENIVPKPSIKDKFFSTNVKKHANLPTRKDRENLQKYYYSRLFANASELCISYVKNDSSEISKFANELFGNIDEQAPSDDAYEHLLCQNKKVEKSGNCINIEVDLSKQIWSATSLKCFLECKRRYYFKYILEINEHHFSPKPQGFEIGSLIHEILEDFYKNNKRIDANIPNNTLNTYFEKKKQNNPYLILELELWKKKLEKFIQNEKKEFPTREKEVYCLEKKFTFDFCNTTLTGKIDRIDKGEDFFEIIDYKTSSNLKVDSLKNYEKSNDFQLEFYYLAQQNFLKESEKNYKITAYYYDLQKAKMLEEIACMEKIELLKKILDEIKNTKDIELKKCNNEYCQYCL